MSRYAQTFSPSDTFTMDPATIMFLATIIDLANNGSKVRMKTFDSVPGPHAGQVISGVARHIVAPDSHNFVSVITADCRLRITGTFESFVPLGHIEAIEQDD